MTFPPNAQPNDPYAWATNQAGHAAIIGIPAALLLLGLGVHPVAAPIIVAFVYTIAWEVAADHWRVDWRDSLMDAANVMAGASIICGALVSYWTAVACVLLWLAIIGFGWWQRR
jgi:hypothetical protein